MDLEGIIGAARGQETRAFERHVNPQLARVLRTIGFDRTWVRGEGAHLWDEQGRRYLDLLSGWGVFNWGRGHPRIREALMEALQSDFPGWIAMEAPPLASALAERLKARCPGELDLVYFCNSGTEGVEAAIKFARAATERSRIVHLKRAFHGLTTGSLSLNGDASFREGFEPFLPGGTQVELGDLEALERELSAGDVAAFVLEPIQGKGVHIPPAGYMKEAQDLCRKHGALLVCDEVQTGMGRTGRFFAHEWEEGVDPDIVVLSKALSGGYVPVGAVLLRRWIYDRVYTDMSRAIVHACTFGMGNLAMVAGLASLEVLDDEQLMPRAERLGAQLSRGLEEMRPRFEFMREVRQRGLMVGIEFGKPRSMGLRTAWALIHKMDPNLFTQGVVIPLFDDHCVLTQVAGHESETVKLLPPLVIDEEDVRWFLSAFEKVMESIHRFPGPVWEVLKKLGKHAIGGRLKGRRAGAADVPLET